MGRRCPTRAFPRNSAQFGATLADAAPNEAPTTELPCDQSSRVPPETSAASPQQEALRAQLTKSSPYAWGGVGDIIFQPDGGLKTPWGQGTWGLHPGAPAQSFFADFIGAKHNVRMMQSGLAVSTRCSDGNVVLLRSIKAAKART